MIPLSRFPTSGKLPAVAPQSKQEAAMIGNTWSRLSSPPSTITTHAIVASNEPKAQPINVPAILAKLPCRIGSDLHSIHRSKLDMKSIAARKEPTNEITRMNTIPMWEKSAKAIATLATNRSVSNREICQGLEGSVIFKSFSAVWRCLTCPVALLVLQHRRYLIWRICPLIPAILRHEYYGERLVFNVVQICQVSAES